MATCRRCIAEILTADGDVKEIEYKSIYSIGSRGNLLDMEWRASMMYDIPINSTAIDSIHIKYAQED